MKGKYCIFYEEVGGRVAVVRETGSGKTRARERSRWTVGGSEEKTENKVVVERRSKLECVGGLQKEGAGGEGERAF